MTSESIKVAVRIRPFNSREKERGAKAIIQMVGKTTKIVHPDDPQNIKTFNFDYSYWSHDQFIESDDGQLVPDGPNSPYASQQRVFEDLGKDVLSNTMEGYNCSLFAYGQTGSGKSYSMVGYDKNRGIVPIICNELFNIVQSNTNGSDKFAITFSMLEIYNERVRDLLKKSSENLEVRLSDKVGFYVQNLEKVPVASYKEIEKRMAQGIANRTIAATQMNATSSRAHTVITVEFKQLICSESGINTKSSVINLIDLAGSERADSTGATGDRLKEGASINKSLSALGNVIAALADQAGGKTNILVPYRDSVLTKMLKNALGGNSKTVMIAAISPANINYDETLSTLRYADRAKRIKNIATVNENPLEKLIRELKDENERLKKNLNDELQYKMNTESLSQDEINKIRREIEEELIAGMRDKSELLELNDMSSWQEKVREAEQENVTEDISIVEMQKEKYPFLCNLNEDAQLSGLLVYFIDNENVSIGKSPEEDNGVIKIGGPGIQNMHAVLMWDPDSKIVTITPCTILSVVRVNGVNISSSTVLNDLDRVLLGSSNLYIFHNPIIRTNDSILYDWEEAQKEIAAADGYNSEEKNAFESQIIEILPLVSEVNAISTEMNRNRVFKVLIIPQIAQDMLYGEEVKPKVVIKMTNTLNQNSWLWERSKFINRRYMIQELYQEFINGEGHVDISNEEDPFWDPTEDMIVGNSHAFLSNLTYNLSMNYSMGVVDYKGLEEGTLSVNIGPCNKMGQMPDDDDDSSFIEDANELLGKPYYVKITVIKLCIYKHRFIHGSTVKFRVYRDDVTYCTPTVTDTLEPQFNNSTIIEFPTITKDHLEYFSKGSIIFCIYGTQKDKPIAVPALKSRHTASERLTTTGFDLSRQAAILRTYEVLNKMNNKKNEQLKQLCIQWASKPEIEQQFNPFYKSVSSIAFSSGKKFKVVADVVRKSRVLMNVFHKNNADEQVGNSEPERAKIIISRKADGKDASEICTTM